MAKGNKTLVNALIWGVLGIVVVGISVLFVKTRLDQAILLSEKMPIYSRVPDFVLTNQLGTAVSAGDLSGQVWIACIVFTRCPGPCPKMAEKMADLQKLWPAETPIRFVTLTTDPVYDTVPVMKRFAERFHAEAGRWHFLTGPKSEIVRVAVDGLKLTTMDKEANERVSEADMFIHSTVFMLVDQKGRVRGSVESLEPGFEEQIRTAADALLRTKPR